MSLSSETKIIDGIDVSNWTLEQVAELQAAVNEKTIADQDLASVAAEYSQPAYVIAERRKAAEDAKRDAADARAFTDAKKKFGIDDVCTIDTRLGMIIMRTATGDEDKLQVDRAKAARDRNAPEEEVEFAQWEVLLETVVHPSRSRVEEITTKYPRVKGLMWVSYMKLIECATDRALGK